MSDYLKQPQLKAELEKCLQCKNKPCMHACPVACSPCDFIAHAKQGDWNAAATEILRQNPLGEICGLICPDKFCQKACLRANIDSAIKIPEVQATIMNKAENVKFESAADNGKKIAVIGLGPAGMSAVAEALKHGFRVHAFEKEPTIGGALNLIPQNRLPRQVLSKEWQRISDSPLLKVSLGVKISDYTELLKQGCDAIIVTIGEQKIRRLNIEGEEFALDYTQYLQNPHKYAAFGHVMIIGGGAVAVDCALTAARLGAAHTEMLVRRGLSNMRITRQEFNSLLNAGIDITTMTRPLKITNSGDKLTIYTTKTEFNRQGQLIDVENTQTPRFGVELIISALGATRAEEPLDNAAIVYAGDFISGGSTAVEAIAAGKQAVQKVIKKVFD